MTDDLDDWEYLERITDDIYRIGVQVTPCTCGASVYSWLDIDHFGIIDRMVLQHGRDNPEAVLVVTAQGLSLGDYKHQRRMWIARVHAYEEVEVNG